MEKRDQGYINKLSRMINIPTISTRDGFDKATFDKFHDLLKELFPNVFKSFKYEEFDGSILLSYLVDNINEPILLMSHHDVVGPNGEWKFEPFNAQVSDGKLYGRGTLDTKGNLFAILTSIEELLEEGFSFTRSIYIESSCNEETTSMGAYTISQELIKRNVHFLFTLDEGGMIVYDPIGGADGEFAMIALAEKDCIDLKFVARSKGGHSSTPDGTNPLVRLSQLVVYIDNHKIFKPHLDDITLETFRKLSAKMKGILGFIFKHSRLFKRPLAKLMVKFSPTASSMAQTTICFTRAQGSDALNVIPDEAYVTANLRVAHINSTEEVIDKLRKIASKFDVEIEVLDGGYASPICDFNSDTYQFFASLVEEQFDGVIAAPYLSTGASDSKFFNKLSNNVFRFAPFKVTNEQLDTIHAKDENIDVSALAPAVDFYKALLRKI